MRVSPMRDSSSCRAGSAPDEERQGAWARQQVPQQNTASCEACMAHAGGMVPGCFPPLNKSPARQGCRGWRWCCCGGTILQWPCQARCGRHLQAAKRQRWQQQWQHGREAANNSGCSRYSRRAQRGAVWGQASQPCLRGASDGSRSTARCRRRRPTCSAQRSAAPPPLGSPAAHQGRMVVLASGACRHHR